MKRILLTIALFAVSQAAYALDLTTARTTGAVCEQADGYVAAKSGDSAVKSLVSEVNAKRRAEYQKISAGNGQPLDVVSALAAKQIASQPGVAACK